MTGLEHALVGLRLALESPRRQRTWRALVRQRLQAVHGALERQAERGDGEDGPWLAGRERALERDRLQLLARVAVLGPVLTHAPDVETVVPDVRRLLVDLEHHRQRLDDLVYDAVSLELGGSD